MSLLGKAFVVTGGASGIGRTTVRKLLKLSAQVHVIDAAREIQKHQGLAGQQHLYPNVDVASRKDVRAVFDQIATKHTHHLSGLVHCAAILRPTECSEEGDENLRQLLDVNVVGTWNINTEFHRFYQSSSEPVPGAQTGNTTSIVNIGSMASTRGLPTLPGYVASKHAVLGLSRSFAQAWGPEGLRVNCIAPGAVNTPMIKGMTEDATTTTAYNGALKTLLEPEEIAETIMFLLKESSSGITGQVIEVNGGWP